MVCAELCYYLIHSGFVGCEPGVAFYYAGSAQTRHRGYVVVVRTNDDCVAYCLGEFDCVLD